MLKQEPILSVILPEQDAEFVKSIDLPVEIAVLNQDASSIVSDDGLVKYSIHELSSHCIGGVASNATGVKSVERFLEIMAEATGTNPLPLCNLSKLKAQSREARLRCFITDAFALALERQVRRVAELSRSLGALRQIHGQMQDAFAHLEKFVLDNNLAERTETLALLPGRDMAPLDLREGESLTQRLPISSVGLSDVDLFIENADFGIDGVLSVELRTQEDDAVKGIWKLSGNQLAKGPVRLALHTALESAPLAPILNLTWQGEGLVQLSTSLYHPDPRLQAHINSRNDPRVLAIRCRSYLPGSAAPIPAGAHLPIDLRALKPLVRVLDNMMLSQAENLTPDSEHSHYLADEEALLVHPLPQGISRVRIAAAIPAGTIHIDARIFTLADKAGKIEYALGIAPTVQEFLMAETFETDFLSKITSWVQLSPQVKGELHLPLADPLQEDHDLFLMTQMPVQPGDTSWGWATFSRIRIQVA